MRSGKCYKTIFFVLLCFTNIQAQKRFINRLDTTFAGNSYFTAETGNTCSGEQLLDPYHIDYDLINCLVIREINAYRTKRHLPLLQYNHRLDMLAQNYLHYFNRNTFIHETKNRIKLKRPLKKAALKMDYHNGIIAPVIYQAALVLASKKMPVFYCEEQNNDPLNLFYGEQPGKKEIASGYVFDPVKPVTYSAFVKDLFYKKILRTQRRVIHDRAMCQVGCRSLVIKQSLHKHQFPAASFMVILGAPRLRLLPPDSK